jgi:type VI secretion system protein ImpH
MSEPVDPLEAAPERFDFFQAVRRVEGRAQRRVVPVGVGSDTRDEAVHFEGAMSGAHPAGDIASFEPAAGGKPARMVVNFLSLGGAFGPLPAPIDELIQKRRRIRDRERDATANFLDIFNHRLTSLMVRVRRSHRLALQTGEPDETDQAHTLQALLGLGTPSLRRTEKGAGRTLDRGLLYLTGLLNEKPVSLHALERAVSYFFDVPVRGEPFRGAWLDIPPDQLTRLGRTGANNRLGGDALLGSRAWAQAAGIRLTLGPLSLEQFDRLLPDGPAHLALRRLLAFVLGGDYAVELLLKLDTTVGAVRKGLGLGVSGERLGWKSWLLTDAERAEARFEAVVPLYLGEIAEGRA